MNCARSDLCGGRPATGVPTAIAIAVSLCTLVMRLETGRFREPEASRRASVAFKRRPHHLKCLVHLLPDIGGDLIRQDVDNPDKTTIVGAIRSDLQ